MQGIELFSTVSVLVNHEADSDDDTGDDDSVNGDDVGGISAEDGNSKQSPANNQLNKLLNVHKLDSCSILVYPPLNPDHEFFRLPVNYMTRLGLLYTKTKDGIIIHGKSRNINVLIFFILHFTI